MKLLKGEHIHLRALEPEDLEVLYALENDPDIWEVSGTLTPYSKKVLRDYLERSHQDIYEMKQLRLAICTDPGSPIGLIDLYDFDPKHLRAGLGIGISQAGDRDRVVACFAEDCTIELLGIRLRGHAGVRRWLHWVFAHIERIEFSPRVISVDGDTFIEEFEMTGTHAGGRSLESQWAEMLTYRDNLVTSLRV